MHLRSTTRPGSSDLGSPPRRQELIDRRCRTAERWRCGSMSCIERRLPKVKLTHTGPNPDLHQPLSYLPASPR